MIRSEYSEDAVIREIGEFIGSVFGLRVVLDLNKVIQNKTTKL
jgi:hypothetical protein